MTKIRTHKTWMTVRAAQKLNLGSLESDGLSLNPPWANISLSGLQFLIFCGAFKKNFHAKIPDTGNSMVITKGKWSEER